MGFIGTAWQGLLDIIYPPQCLVCGEMQPQYLCPNCEAKIEAIGPISCERCGAPLESEVCWECHGKRFHFDSVRCYGQYSGVLREAIHQFKYSGHRQLAPQLGCLLAAAWRERPSVPIVDGIVAVPIHRAREQERGFNQSALLAEVLSKDLGLPHIAGALARKRATKPQVNLSIEERAENVKGAFTPGLQDTAGRNLILVDDVVTTGSTLDDAARALKSAGTASVHGLVLARSFQFV